MLSSQADLTTGCNGRLLRPLVPLYAAGPFLFNTSLFTVQEKKNLTKIFTMRERKEKKVVKKHFFLFVCISFLFLRFFFSPFIRFVLFQLREVSSMMSNKQTHTKKRINPIISASIAQSQRGFGDGMESYCPYSWMNTEGGRRRRRRRRKKVNKVHGGESSNSSRRQKMAAQLTVRKHSPHCHAGGVSACVVWMLNKQIKKKKTKN